MKSVIKSLALMAIALAFGCTCTPEANNNSQENKEVAVTGVILTRTELSLGAGDSFTLKARVVPANATHQTLLWSSSDENIVTIDAHSGEGRAVDEGNATVSVKTAEGGFTASCEITVVGHWTPSPDPEPDPNPNPQPDPSDPGAPAAYGAVPSAGQLAWQKREMLMFYHFGQATFSGYDGENEGIDWSEEMLLNNYTPSKIDADQWVKTAADNGFKEVILTAKHHDGFCLWDNPESTTDVANAKAKNHTDVVKAVRDACNKYGVAMGIYLSPWDRMIEISGKSTQEYEKMYKSSAKDLMTKYSPVVEFWLDGNHAGNFDWPSVHEAILGVNPDCVIFSDGGPGCRWVGNENGAAGETNWSTLNVESRGITPGHAGNNYETVLGSGDRDGESWVPAECDFSIQDIGDRDGWFYDPSDNVKSAKDLMRIYYTSVGRNGVFLMNVPPDRSGVIGSKEKTVIEEFTRMRKQIFNTNLADGATASASSIRGGNAEKYGPKNLLDGNYDSYFATDDAVKTVDIEIALSGSKTFNRVMLQEYIPLGQRVESFTVQVKRNGSWSNWESGTTIGFKRILLGSTVTTDAVRIQIKSALACPVLNGFGLYNDTVSGL